MVIIDTTLMETILKERFVTETMNKVTRCNVVLGILFVQESGDKLTL